MKNITAIGEILFDVYPNKKKLGGAPFNFIYHIINLTGKGNFVSRIGKDELGNEIFMFLKTHNISADYVQIDNDKKTGVARPTLNEKKVPEWVIEKERAYDFIENNSNLSKLINQETGCLYFGTLAQREKVSRETIQSFFPHNGRFSSNNIKHFCDLNIRQNFYSKEVLIESLKAANVLKLNSDEIKIINKELFNSEINLKDLPKKIIDEYGVDLLCLTKGENGATLFKDGEINSTQVPAEKIVDTVGAGDAYASILCLGYLNNWELQKINELASKFANEIIKVNGALPENGTVYSRFKEKMS